MSDLMKMLRQAIDEHAHAEAQLHWENDQGIGSGPVRAAKMARAAKATLDRVLEEVERRLTPAAPHRCADSCPPGYTGHWREWHRGHGCHLDPNLKEQG